MKKTKKLTLNRETLRNLEENRMAEIAAGAPPPTLRRDCYTQYTYCGSCGIACTIDCVP